MKKKLCLLIYLIFQNIGYSQLTINKAGTYDSNKSITINAFVDTLDINKINTIKILSATAKIDNEQIINSSEAYPDMYYQDSDNSIQTIFKNLSKPIYKIDTLKVKVKYFTPTEENKSLITIKNPLQKFGLNLIENEYPKMKFILLDFHALKNLKRKNKKKYKTLIEKIEENNKVAKDSIASFVNKAIQEYKELKLSDAEYKKRLLFYIEDEKREIKKVSLYDKNGEDIGLALYNIWSKSYTSRIQIQLCREIPEDTWTIKLHIENEKSTKEIELKMENIIIPKN